MTNLEKVIGGIAVIACILSVVVFFRVPGIPGASTVNQFGATTGPERFNDCESTNGIETCFGRTGLKTATTTVCAIQSPTNATSTLVSGSVRFSTSGVASIITIAKGATAYATTTSLGRITLAANAQATIVASSTPSTSSADDLNVFAPGKWFVVGMEGAATFSPVGVCQAQFRKI